MKVRLAKWGNSLAVRIPGECARQAHVKAGDALEIEVTATGDLRLRPMAELFDRTSFLKQVQALRAHLSMGEPVVEAMRESDRF
ncbi:AbrB/MazE/SpoVT family DNA-binding domain-containing protein [Accumulibacter sp.]|uniref:AbrB/MazE/SpoVT family DNA-binding domain-containing protein n=1 Tax=Accumulibacter sp. TaxID=2053492 RepID=UPI0025D73932|nr:AbrB/MazE/SpoVT family DNA-binding domain-containing protein [Accumulibacter sp.]MCM8613201.1 AbrB/MazE/SpoVT family DNA-binding domain-containing protein [Accumulibacter sp.]MCM8636512.1 AbrB/MazE/SpoVT family DNA-binding domain-containing protein [Accumulibacter sp.]MCM8640254.1 AbrB/MazE/SpoVT family DNA-binding domain-containing protein [Accumulibacter sp.]